MYEYTIYVQDMQICVCIWICMQAGAQRVDEKKKEKEVSFHTHGNTAILQHVHVVLVDHIFTLKTVVLKQWYIMILR